MGEAAIYALALAIVSAALVGVSFEQFEFLPSLGRGAVGFFAAVAAVYVGGLAGVAAAIAGRT